MTPEELTATYDSLVTRLQATEKVVLDTGTTMQAAQANFTKTQKAALDAAQILQDAIHNHNSAEHELQLVTSSLIKLCIEHPELSQP
jgi:hypothetical protein